MKLSKSRLSIVKAFAYEIFYENFPVVYRSQFHPGSGTPFYRNPTLLGVAPSLV